MGAISMLRGPPHAPKTSPRRPNGHIRGAGEVLGAGDVLEVGEAMGSTRDAEAGEEEAGSPCGDAAAAEEGTLIDI